MILFITELCMVDDTFLGLVGANIILHWVYPYDAYLYNAMWKFSRFFGKISVKSPFSLLIEYYYWRMNWFHEIFFEEEWISWFSTLRVTWQNVYRILFSWFFSKNSVKSNYFIIASYFYIAFTRFFQIILMT